MISGKKLFIEISNQPVHEDGESVGYFIKTSRMNDLEVLLSATAQPVSNGWVFESCENEPCPNGAVVNVLGADIHLCAACSVDKKYSRMKIIALPKRLSLPLPAAPGGQDDKG